jgi:hypothetical protein
MVIPGDDFFIDNLLEIRKIKDHAVWVNPAGNSDPQAIGMAVKLAALTEYVTVFPVCQAVEKQPVGCVKSELSGNCKHKPPLSCCRTSPTYVCQ